MLKSRICDLFGIRFPIIQGAMAHLATAELVSAVSDAGGLGVIAAANYDAQWLRDQIRKTREQTKKPFGVNLYLPSPYIKEQINLVLNEKVSVVVLGAGNPEEYLPLLRKAGLKVMPVISNVNMAKRLEIAGVDALVAEGSEAGGHIGTTGTMTLIPEVTREVGIPVVAAGGIADGRGLAAALALGAEGIQMGTRFICSDECLAHPAFKQKILKSQDGSTVITGTISGDRVRCLANAFTRDFLSLEKAGATLEELEMVSHGRLFKGIVEGDIEEGWLMAGQSCGLIKSIKPAKLIIEETAAEAEKIMTDLCREIHTEEDYA
jgi:enoyl-[acyl-carrier protein] reductase II